MHLCILYVVLHMPEQVPFLPPLSLQVHQYDKLSRRNKLIHCIVFDKYCQIVFISQESIPELISRCREANPHCSGKYLESAPFLCDLMIYGRWDAIPSLASTFRQYTKTIDMPTHYCQKTAQVETAFSQVKGIFPEMEDNRIRCYLKYYNGEVEALVNAGLEGQLPSDATLTGVVPTKTPTLSPDADMKQLALEKLQLMYDSDEDNENDDTVYVERIVMAYALHGPTLFSRDSRQRSERLTLQTELNWSPEQVEGWYRMSNKSTLEAWAQRVDLAPLNRQNQTIGAKKKKARRGRSKGK